MPRALLILLFAPALAVGCSSSNSDPGPKPTTAPTATTTKAPPPPAPKPGKALKAGVYQSATFRPRVHFRVGDGWGTGYDRPTHLDLYRGSRDNQLSFLSALREDTPAKALAQLRRVEGLGVSNVSSGGFGPYEGLQFDAAANSPAPVVFEALDNYTVFSGLSTRMWIVIAGDRTVVAAVQGRGDFARFLARAEQVLDSARFG